MQPMRRSSEAPEVVLQIPTEWAFSRTDSPDTNRKFDDEQARDQVAERPRIEPDGYPRPSSVEKIVRSKKKEDYPRRRTCGFITTTLLVLTALLIGGGIGGGVGGALVAKERAKPAPVPATVTVTAPSSVATTILDAAGCPLINNSTYTPPGTSSTFLRLCGIEILPSAGQNIDFSSSAQTSIEACLNTCAKANGCVGASWVVFSPTTPIKNNMCFLKNGTGVEAGANGQTVVSGYLR